jgi:GntR family transcriptional regulator of arabinose operon
MTEELSQFAPKYRIVAAQLTEEIQQGQLELNRVFPSEPELVDRFRVSRSTVRGAIDLLVRDKVLHRERGKGTFITPNQGKTQSTTLVFSYLDAYTLNNPYLNRLYQGFEEGVQEYVTTTGRKISSQCVRHHKKSLGELTLLGAEDSIQAQAVNPPYVQGLCLTATVPVEEVWDIQRRGISCVRLGGTPQEKLPGIHMDEYATIVKVMDHLKTLGHREIGLIMTDTIGEDAGLQLLSQLNAYGRKAGMTIGGKYNVVCRDYNRELAFEGVTELLSRPDRPTALCCFDDFLALGAKDAALKLGLSVPEDLSIVGQGDYLPDTDLTTIAFPLKKMGREAARLLIGLVFDDYQGPMNNKIDDCELVVRESTGVKTN